MRLAALILAALLLPGLALSSASALLTRPCAGLPGETRFDIAVVLGAGLSEGRPNAASAARTDAAVALFNAGRVAALHFTGSAAPGAGMSVAEAMADRAGAAGIPRNAITRETRSMSTLENALFSQAALQDADSVILVTSGFHAWRGAASFYWAGPAVDGLCRSGRLDAPSGRTGAKDLLFEAVKWPANAARALLYVVAARLDRAQTLPDWLLSGTETGAPPHHYHADYEFAYSLVL